jgi:hypothetical protein
VLPGVEGVIQEQINQQLAGLCQDLKTQVGPMFKGIDSQDLGMHKLILLRILTVQSTAIKILSSAISLHASSSTDIFNHKQLSI